MAQLTVIFARVLQAIPTVFGIVVVTFLLTRALPGDPAAYFAGASATPESIAEIRAKLGLDQSLPVQFAGYIKDLATGNLGESISTGQPVATELLKRLPASLELTLFALLLSVVVSIPLGVLAAVHQDSLDRPAVPLHRHRRRQPADLLHRPAAGLRVLFSARCRAGAAGAPRSAEHSAAARDRLLCASTACWRANGARPGRRSSNCCCPASRWHCSRWRRWRA